MENEIQHLVHTPLGWFQLIGNALSITQSYWVAEDEAVVGGKSFFPNWLKTADQQIKQYFDGSRTQFQLPIALPQNSDEHHILQATMQIEYGQTSNSVALINILSSNNGKDHVGSVLVSNPLLLLVPCHRVVPQNDASITYAGGKERQEWLLQHEAVFKPKQLNLFGV